MNKSTAYAILGVPENAPIDDVKTAYRRLAMKHHPDRGGDEAEFKRINEAHDAIRNNEFTSFYADIGKKFNFYKDMADQRAASFTVRQSTIAITLKEAFTGVTKLVAILGKNVHVAVPAGVSPNDVLFEDNINGQQCQLFAKIDEGATVDYLSGNVKLDFYVSPIRMILGGWTNAIMIDDTEVSVRIPPGLEANKILKVQGRGYWKNQKCQSRGDCLLRVIPHIQKLGDMAVSDLSELMEEYGKLLEPKGEQA